MKGWLAGIVVALPLATGALAQEGGGMRLHETPQALPEIVFADEQGAPLTLDAWRGKVVLLNVWATWCGPCRAEMPTLDRLQAAIGGEKFEVVALSIDRAGTGVVRRFFDEIGIGHLRLFIDESGTALRTLKIFGLPATILVGTDGRELARLLGPAEWDTPEMIAFFKEVIAAQDAQDLKE
ncbi:MAG: TlpA family protein disulfide reductase [Hyphomicrobiales bacterium]|nr:TlpA family protein disulfide reductase [Hyphomicrobiales bacterium]